MRTSLMVKVDILALVGVILTSLYCSWCKVKDESGRRCKREPKRFRETFWQLGLDSETVTEVCGRAHR